jgi:hypothetical protein
MFSTDFIFRQQENLVDNQKCQAGFRPLCNKILFSIFISFLIIVVDEYLASADSYESVFLATFLVSYIGMPSSASGKKIVH